MPLSGGIVRCNNHKFCLNSKHLFFIVYSSWYRETKINNLLSLIIIIHIVLKILILSVDNHDDDPDEKKPSLSRLANVIIRRLTRALAHQRNHCDETFSPQQNHTSIFLATKCADLWSLISDLWSRNRIIFYLLTTKCADLLHQSPYCEQKSKPVWPWSDIPVSGVYYNTLIT